MEIRLSKKDVIWSYVGTILNMGSNFIMLPIIMLYLDGEMLGLWYVFMSIGTIAMLFDVGFGVTFARNITYCWSGVKEIKAVDAAFTENVEPDFSLMKKVITACQRIYLRLAGSAFLLLVTVGTLYVYIISNSLDGHEQYVAWIMFSMAVFLNLYYGYYTTFLRGVGAIEQANKNVVISRIVQIGLTFFLLYCGFGIIGVCIAYLSYGTLFRILGKQKFYKCQEIGDKLSQITDCLDSKEIKNLVGIVWHNAWRDGVISTSNYLSNQASTIICSLYLTLTETGAYSIAVQLAMAIATISGTLYMAYQPQLQAAYVNKNIKKMQDGMSVIVVSLVYLFIIGVIGTALIILPLLRLLKPESVVSIPIFIALCAYHFILKYRDCFTSYFSCTNRILYLKSFVIASVLCIVLSFVLTGFLSYGVWGLIMAQITSQIIFNLWYWSYKAHNELGLSYCQMVQNGNKLLLRKLKKHN